MSFDRRHFMKSLVLGSLGLSFSGRRVQAAQATTQRKFVFAYFEGGWDILLSLDPRNPVTTRPDTHKIETGYGQLGGVYQQRGVRRVGSLQLGPAIPPELLTHASRFSVVNGVGMDTAAHEVGRRYFITGKFPRGLQAVGSSAGAELVAQLGDRSPIPYMSAGVESYATGLPPFAAAMEVNAIEDLLTALTPFVSIDSDVLAAVREYQDTELPCGGERLDGAGAVTSLRESQKRARVFVEAQLGRAFDLQRQDPEMDGLRNLYGIDAGASTDSPEVLSFVAAQAIKSNTSQCVSVRMATGLDTHSNWAQDHAPRLERGFRCLAALMSDLAASSGSNGSLLDETTILAFSEFGRTPMFNNLRGRDHHLGNSCLLAGAGIKGGLTVGASAEVGMMPVYTDLSTGRSFETQEGSAVTLSPKHVLATMFASAGFDFSDLRAEPISALLA